MALELPKAALSVLPSPDLLLFLAKVGAQSALGWVALGGRHYKAFPVQEEGSAPSTVLV